MFIVFDTELNYFQELTTCMDFKLSLWGGYVFNTLYYVHQF